MTIDLDNLFADDDELNPSQKTTSSTPSTEGDAAIISDMTDLVISTPTSPKAAPAASLADIYDRFLKRIYLFDISGSMTTKMVGDETADSIEWNEYRLQHIEEQIKEIHSKEERLNTWMLEHDADGDIPSHLQLDSLDTVLSTYEDPLPSDVDEEEKPAAIESMKQFIVDNHLMLDLGLHAKDGTELPSRMDLVSTTCLSMIKQRYDKYPEADVSAFAFDTKATPLDSRPKERLFEEIEALRRRFGGGTDIKVAFDAAFALIKGSPSPMQMNHIVVVSDGEDNVADYINEVAAKRCKALNIVVDFIHVTTPYHDFEDASTVDALKALCTNTKGEYTKVTTRTEFEQKLIAASTRLLLPPGSN